MKDTLLVNKKLKIFLLDFDLYVEGAGYDDLVSIELKDNSIMTLKKRVIDKKTFHILYNPGYNVLYQIYNLYLNINDKRVEYTVSGRLIFKEKKFFSMKPQISKVAYFILTKLNFRFYNFARTIYKHNIDETNFRWYVKNLNEYEINEKRVFIESSNSNDLSGSMFYTAIEMANRGYDVYVSYKHDNVLKKIEYYGLNITPVYRFDKMFYEMLLTSKYLFNDSTFIRSYIKREGQVYCNSWHGTPLKHMGKSIDDNGKSVSNIQLNFSQCDVLGLNNQFTIDIFSNEYDIITPKNVFKLPNPKFQGLLNVSRRTEIRRELGLVGKKVICFLPTWRGTWGGTVDEQNYLIFEQIKDVAAMLPKEYVLYVKVHSSLHNKIDLSGLNVISEQYELYDFLSMTDCLITDYSSIMFDYAVLNKKIILYTPDYSSYINERGMYMDISKLPFSHVTTKRGLLTQILDTNYDIKGLEEFNEIYNPLENSNSATSFIDSCLNIRVNALEAKIKKRVLIFPGALELNGITNSFFNLISNVDTSRVEYYIFLPDGFYKSDVELNFPKNIKVIFSPGGRVANRHEEYVLSKLNNRMKLSDEDFEILKEIASREVNRLFGGFKFDYAIHFSGYEAWVSILFSTLKTKSIVFVHNQMDKEFEVKRNFNQFVLQNAYKNAHKICTVSEPNRLSFKKNILNENKVVLCRNTINVEEIKNRSLETIDLYENDYEVLNDNNIIKFMNIGRFNYEKGTVRLIEQFLNVCSANPNDDLHLFIAGVSGPEEENVFNLAKGHSNISVYKEINPLPILKNCNLFVLSSFHEGLPMVFFEALSLNVPIGSTDIEGPTHFLNQGYGRIFENSDLGVFNIMDSYIKEPWNVELEVDTYNEQALNDFYEIIGE